MEKIQKIEAEIEALEYEFSKKIARKRRALRKAKFGNTDQMQFTVQYLIDGVIEGKRVEFYRGVNIYPHSFEWFMEHCMIVESLRKPGGTHLDLVIDKYAKLFHIQNDEKERLMQKYWHKKQETIAEIVAAWTDFEREIYATQELFVEHIMGSALRKFELAPTEIQYGILYWIFSHHEKGDFEELRRDIDRIPEKIRDLVDRLAS